jgi:isopenicillin-N N-acyltransferase like protein
VTEPTGARASSPEPASGADPAAGGRARVERGRVGRIPSIRVSGSHREVGRGVGLATTPTIRTAVAAIDGDLPAGRTRAEQLALAALYRDATRAATPWLVQEIDGAAEGAGVDPMELFAASIEEIWTVRPTQPGEEPVAGRCSDLVAGPPLTADGHLWVAHTNDLSPESESEIVAVEWRVPGEPTVLSVGSGPWISVGWNAAGLSLTGNELAPNDQRIGVPRLLMVREQLTAPALDAAVAMALRPDRASSYNTVFAWPDGRVVNVEGSASAAEVTGLDGRGTLAHTNHYVCPAMLGYEGDPVYARASVVRYWRARALLDAAAPGTVCRETLRGWLADHATRPPICRHGLPDEAITDAGWRGKTVFWCIADVTAGEVEYGLGNPCAAGPGERRRYRE